jgi:hypothetical protein
VVGWARDASGQQRATLWVRLDPVAMLERLAEEVENLEDAGVLNAGQAHALTNHLDAAAALLDDGRTAQAVQRLHAFIRQVEALVRGGDLSDADGEALIAAAQALIARTSS